MEKTYDIVLFGATGFTGQLIAKYIDQYSPHEKIRWAIAGRNRQKLEKLQNQLQGLIMPDIVIADIEEEESLDKMTSAASILMNAAGPFEWYGRKVVSACIKNKCNYLDITGEPEFITDIAEYYHNAAVNERLTIVNCCGFDSVPADLATWIAVKNLPQGKPIAARVFIRTNARFSGGTLITAVNAIHRKLTGKRRPRKLKPKHPDAPAININIHKEKELKAWAIPMPVADIHIVKRSAFLMPEDYGYAFSYAQFFLKSSFYKMLRLIIPILTGMTMLRFKWFRNYLFKRFRPGKGPTDMQRAKAKFEVLCIARSSDKEVRVVISGGDPGYDETAKMFSESAFTLLGKIRTKSQNFGVLTPVVALGEDLVHRLKNKGINIDVIKS